jgi:hypothetical protein
VRAYIRVWVEDVAIFCLQFDGQTMPATVDVKFLPPDGTYILVPGAFNGAIVGPRSRAHGGNTKRGVFPVGAFAQQPGRRTEPKEHAAFEADRKTAVSKLACAQAQVVITTTGKAFLADLATILVLRTRSQCKKSSMRPT